MLPEYFAIISALISSAGGVYYLFKTVRGQVKPNRVTWLLWGVLPMIAFAAQRSQGVEDIAWITFAAGLVPLLIVIASFLNKRAYWKTQRHDYYVAAGAVVGIILWIATNSPNIAILVMITTDFLASLPTILKSYRFPKTESPAAYAISMFGFGIGILAIPNYTFENYAFVTYLFIISGLLTFLTSRKRTLK